MNIMELGAIGELVGGVAVIGSLLYVGFQIRQNTTWQMRLGFKHSLDNLKDSGARISSDKETTQLYLAGCKSYSALDEADQLRFHCLEIERLAAIELGFDMHKSRSIKVETINAMQRWLRDDFARSGVRDWWESRGRREMADDFSAAVDDLVRDVVVEEA